MQGQPPSITAMPLLIAYNSAAINAEERTREHATMFAYGVPAARVMRGNVIEALLTGVLATAIGIAAGFAILRWMVDVSMANTMPDLGTLVSIRCSPTRSRYLPAP
jgi:putative ABC transport system permease protein